MAIVNDEDVDVEVEDEGEENVRMIGQPFVLQFEDGLVLEVTADMECTPVAEAYQEAGRWRQSDVSLSFFRYLLKSNLLAPPGLASQSAPTHENFLAYANLHPTNLCKLIGQYKNVGEDYNNSSSCVFNEIYDPSITLIDNDGNQHESYFVFPVPTPGCTSGPWVFPIGHTAISYPHYWFLSDDLEIDKLIFSGEPEDFVVIAQ